MWEFKEPSSTLKFANTDLELKANSFKLNFRVENWPFQNSENNLHLEFEHLGKNTECENYEYDPQENPSWLMVVGSHTKLYLITLRV